MPRTPSIGLDQNGDRKFRDKYWGRVPIYTHIIPETLYTDNPIYMCNPEFIELYNQYLTGDIDKENLSQELYGQIEEIINLIPKYGRIPLPEYDPFFECVLGPKDPNMACALLADKDCHPIVDADGCYLSPPSEDIWDYVYFTDADPQSYGVFVIDWRKMKLVAHVPSVNPNPHSVDRACNTDRMYLRTQNSHYSDVMDARTREIVRSIPLPFKPRTTGDPNLYLNIQLIAGKDHPQVAVIDVLNFDNVIQVVGVQTKPGQKPSGNQGGSACGHPAWFDAHHFGLLDRINDEVIVYRVTESTGEPRFTISEVQRLATPTGCHTIDTDVIHLNLSDKVFWAISEGSKELGKTPGLHRLDWVNGRLIWSKDSSGNLIEWYFPEPPSSDEDATHHYGYNEETNEIWYPSFKSGKMYVLDADTLQVKDNYPCGHGGGHVNFSYRYKMACVTNHFDNVVHIIDWETGVDYSITVNNEPVIPATHLIQTHENKILPEEGIIGEEDESGRYYFLGVTTPTGGEFKRIDLKALKSGQQVVETLVTGGHPEQSTS